MSKKAPSTSAATAQKFLSFINRSWTPFHAVAELSARLDAAGFVKLTENSSWKLQAGGKYYFARNASALVAFAVGDKFKAGNGFNIIGCHTDSPDLKVKPVSKNDASGYLRVAVSPYGGGIWHTWFDRDLTVAGRVLVEEEDGSFVHKLCRIEKPILRISTLAIHLDRAVNEKFVFNKQTHLAPILATSVAQDLNGGPGVQASEGSQADKHHAALTTLMAKSLDVDVEQIRDFELSVVDFQDSAVGGALDEFIFSPRLDNLGMSWCTMEAFLDSLPSLGDESNVRVVALFDHEEVGSSTAQGAGSSMLLDAMRRITTVMASEEEKKETQDLFEVAVQRSFLVSADMAHAVHPNYSEKHDPDHKPAMHHGVAIKFNTNQRYATNSVTAHVLRELAKRNDIPIQDFVVKNDSPCGSTIGPILAAGVGIRTVDMGAPMLSMHSIREMCATTDLDHSVNLFRAFYDQFTALDAQIKMERIEKGFTRERDRRAPARRAIGGLRGRTAARRARERDRRRPGRHGGGPRTRRSGSR